jgi:hypothetical protein
MLVVASPAESDGLPVIAGAGCGVPGAEELRSGVRESEKLEIARDDPCDPTITLPRHFLPLIHFVQTSSPRPT